MYWQKKYEFAESNEYEYIFAGKYGAKGEQRGKRRKLSGIEKEMARKHNQRTRVKNMRRLIKANFRENDLFLTLKYPKDTRKNIKDVQKDLRNFLRRLKTRYTKKGQILKYIYRMEIGALGGIHIHMIVNRAEDADIMVRDAWNNPVNYQNMYEEGGYSKLAEYMTKEPEEDEEEYQQLSLFEEKEQGELLKVSSSRNLIRPIPEIKEYKRRTVRKMIVEGIKASEGYVLDKSSVQQYANKVTGYTHLCYTEVKVRKKWENQEHYQQHSPRVIS